jgi:hypothetical protein
MEQPLVTSNIINTFPPESIHQFAKFITGRSDILPSCMNGKIIQGIIKFVSKSLPRDGSEITYDNAKVIITCAACNFFMSQPSIGRDIPNMFSPELINQFAEFIIGKSNMLPNYMNGRIIQAIIRFIPDHLPENGSEITYDAAEDIITSAIFDFLFNRETVSNQQITSEQSNSTELLHDRSNLPSVDLDEPSCWSSCHCNLL